MVHIDEHEDAVVDKYFDGEDAVEDKGKELASVAACDVACAVVVGAGHSVLLGRNVVVREGRKKSRMSCYEYSHSDHGTVDREAFLNILADQALVGKLQ